MEESLLVTLLEMLCMLTAAEHIYGSQDSTHFLYLISGQAWTQKV